MSKSRPSERLSANQYQKLSAEVRKLKPKHESIPLRRYWTLGGKVMQLGSRYGEDRVRKLAGSQVQVDVNGASGDNWRVSPNIWAVPSGRYGTR